MKTRYNLTIPSLLIGAVMFLSSMGCSNRADALAKSQTTAPSNSSLAGKEIAVFAGSASKPALDEAAGIFEKQTGIDVCLTYGGSGTVLSQMELSGTGDIYIPGSPDYLAKSESKQLSDPASAKIVAYLVPAICVQSGNPKNIKSLSDLAAPGVRVGIGNPSTVCVGLYAIEILEHSNMLADVYKNIVTQAASCDSTASLISMKSVDAIMGWSVFHDWDPENIDVIYLTPEQIPRLAYIPAAISTFCKEKQAAGAFIDFLTSQTGQDIFRKWGYDVTEAEARNYAPNALVGGDYQLPASYKALAR